MKCICNISNGMLTRTSDENANSLVASGTHKFVGKVAYKMHKNPDYKPGVQVSTKSNIQKQKDGRNY